MDDSHFDGGDLVPAGPHVDEASYRAGYRQVFTELELARHFGRMPTERQLVRGMMRLMRVYATARGGKFVSGQKPDWLLGRADALRKVLASRLWSEPTEMP